MRETLKGKADGSARIPYRKGERKKRKRVFSLEDRFEAVDRKRKKRVCVRTSALVYLYVCTCMPVVCRYTKNRKNIFRGTVNREM